jgi:hypothetical protein
MAAIMNTELSSVDVNGLFHHLTLEEEEIELISGGNNLIPLWSSGLSNLHFSMFTDESNWLESAYYKPLIIYNNKLLTVDISQTDVYLFSTIFCGSYKLVYTKSHPLNN